MNLSLNGLAVLHSAGDAAAYAAAVAAAHAAAPGLPMVLMSEDAAAIDAALSGGLAAEKPLIHAATAANWQAMADVAKKHGCPLAIKVDGGDLNGLAELSAQVTGAGVEDIVLDPGTTTLKADLTAFTQLRRLALKKGAKALGYPIVAVATAKNDLGAVDSVSAPTSRWKAATAWP